MLPLVQMPMLLQRSRMTILTQPISADDFAPFGDVIDIKPKPDAVINDGHCDRFTDLARLDFAADGRAGISLFQSECFTLPYALRMMERHPRGSQAFLPMCQTGFLIMVAGDENGQPSRPLAFLTQPGQGVNIHRNIWHGVLTPLGGSGRFAVIDYIGAGANLETHEFDTPYLIQGAP